MEIRKEEIKEYVKDLKTIKSNLKKIYTIVFGNCTDGVKTMLKADKEFASKSKTFDHAWIIEKVKTIVLGLDTKVNKRVTMHSAMMSFMLMKQYDNEANDAYLTRFKSMIQTLKIAGGEHVLVSKVMLGKELAESTDDEIDNEREKFLAMCFVLRSNETRYAKLLDDLKRSANLGRDEYPESLTEAFNLLIRESGEYDGIRRAYNPRFGRGRGGRGGRGRHGFTFAQQGRGGDRQNVTYTRTNNSNSREIVPGTDGDSHPNVTCFGCQFLGHYSHMCPHVTKTVLILMHIGDLFTNPGLF